MVPYRDGLLLTSCGCGGSSGPEPSPSRQVHRPWSTNRAAVPSMGLAVDQVHGQREVVIRALRDPLVQVPGISGATELGDGRPVLILDAAKLTLS